MKIEVKVPAPSELLPMKEMGKALGYIAEEAADAVKEWYRRLPEDWFDSEVGSFADGTPKHGRGRTFMRPLATEWAAEVRGEGEFELGFRAERDDGAAWGLRLQEMGGMVEPKRARVLTVPLTAEARGRRASEFSGSVHPLFAIGRDSAQGDKQGTLVWRDEAGELHAAYALRKRVYMEPLEKRRGHHGVPQQEELVEMLAPIARGVYRDIFNQL